MELDFLTFLAWTLLDLLLIAVGIGAIVYLFGWAQDYCRKPVLLNRYTVERIGFHTETVDAADASTDELSVQTVHFFDHDRKTIAIYNHVLKVTSLKAEKHVGRG